MLRRVPLRGQRKRNGEGRAGHAEEQAQQQRLFITVDAVFPGDEQGADDDHLADQPGGLGRQAVSQQAHHKAQDGSGQDRRGDDQPALLGGQLQVGGNLHGERA
ncbi:hypothetical protein D3C84_843290 [compost metagenome]